MGATFNLGRRTIQYPPEFDEEFKRAIHKRDGYKCAVCKEEGKLDVHHIDYQKEHTYADNCISLCRECHENVHRERWRWGEIVKQRFYAMIAEMNERKEWADHAT